MSPYVCRLALYAFAATTIWHAAAAASPTDTASRNMSKERSQETTASFSDPSRPGTLQVAIVTGGILVVGGDAKDVVIDAPVGQFDAGITDQATPRGMRHLSQRPSFTVEEEDNLMSIRGFSPLQPIQLEIHVPRRTNLNLSTVNGGAIVVDGVDGDLELGNVNGSITLNDVSGSVVAHDVNGNVLATMTRVGTEKPMSFTTLNGTIDVTLPAPVKANLTLRSDRGNVFTDFNLGSLQHQAPTVEDTRRPGGRYRIEVNKAIYGSLNGGGQEIDLRTFNGNIYLRKGS